MNHPFGAAAVDMIAREITSTVEPGSILQARGHVCAFFHSKEEEYQVLLPFLKQGFERGDRNVHVVEKAERHSHVCRLASAGIDVTSAEQRGQFTLLSTDELYLPDGSFDATRVIDLVQQILEDGKRQGFASTRLMGHVNGESRPDDDTLIEYEAQLNFVLHAYQDPVVCVYDLAAASGAFIVDIMRTHPLIIIGATLYENPFYMAPDEFLRQRRERTARSRGRDESTKA
jgi:hypothetical protein